MNVSNEVITLQFGSIANFVGTHYFNIQEAGFSFNRDFIPDILPTRLFRISEDSSTGALFSCNPRTVIVDEDIRGVLGRSYEKEEVENVCGLEEGSLQIESLSSDEFSQRENNFLKDMKNSRIESESDNSLALFKSHYILDDVNCWTDFMKTELHDKSIINAPKQYKLSCPKSSHYHGIVSSKQSSFSEQLEDNIRFFAEECDNFQGFQVISEGHTAYSGVATSTLHYLKDEYEKKQSLFTPIYFMPQQATNNETDIATYNTVCCLADAVDSVDLIIPLSLIIDPWVRRAHLRHRLFRNITYKGFDKYENSAILAAGLELITLPYRMRDETNIFMSDLSRINVLGRCIAIAGQIIPFPMQSPRSLPKVLDDWTGPFFESISPLCSLDKSGTFYSNYTFSKGLVNKFRPDRSEGCSDEIKNNDFTENFKMFIRMHYMGNHTEHFFSKPNFRIPPTFPQIFNNAYNLTNPDMTEYGRISELYAVGCLVNSKEIGIFLETLHQRSIQSSRKLYIPEEESSHVDFTCVADTIATLASNYSEMYFL